MQLPTEPLWVDSDAELAELCQRWSEQAAIAVDTEFMRSQTFYPHAGLVQIGDGQGCYLIDPLAISDFQPLIDLFVNEAVTKVLHACSEDLEVFRHLLGVVPSPLFDTQIGAAFAGYGFSVGYAGLVSKVLGIDVPKGETRSDWMQRPLSQSQLHYAALDVAYLLVVYGKILQQLKASDRLAWAQSDCAELLEASRDSNDPASYYLKIKSAWKLTRTELAILQRLSEWREVQARSRDVPRNRLLKEGALWELAKRKPGSMAQLTRIEGLPPRTIKTDGETLLALIATEVGGQGLPGRLPAPLPPDQGDLLKALKAEARDTAEAMALPSEVLVRKKEFEFVVRSGMAAGDYQLPPRLKGWRRPVIGDALIDLASNFEPTSR